MSRLIGSLSLITKVRGVLTDVDGYDASPTPIPKIKLVISVVEPVSLAGVVYTSSSGYPTVSSTTDDVARRQAKGVYSLYDIEFPEKVITDSTMWDEQDTTPGVLRKGYLYDFQWCYTIDGINYVETIRYLHDEEARHLVPVQHTYTFGQLKAIATSFLGDDPGSATANEIVNDALQEVWAAHKWAFREADSIALDAVGGQPYLVLPVDFLRLRAVEKSADQNHHMIKVTPREMRQLRERNINTSNTRTCYYVNHNPPVALDQVPRPVMEIWPTPVESGANAYTIDYARICPGVGADSNIPPFPLGLAPLLKQAVRCIAAEQEEDEAADRERAKFELYVKRFAAMDGERLDTDQLGPINRQGLKNPEHLDSSTDPLLFIDPDVDLSGNTN